MAYSAANRRLVALKGPFRSGWNDLPMTHRTFAVVAGIIFTLVALFHLVRIFADWPLIIGDWSVPKSLSWIALIVAGGLALLGFRLAANEED
jgi:hypothetical protein